jgi:chromosome segregation ATPase
MSTAQEISSLKEEREALLAKLKRLEDSLQIVKGKNENAQNAGHQLRLDREHRRLMAERRHCQDEMTMLNARLKLANSRLRAEQIKAKREA